MVAFDLSPQQILMARQRNYRLKLGIELFEGDLTQLQLPDCEFEDVVVVNMLHHVSDRQQALKCGSRPKMSGQGRNCCVVQRIVRRVKG